MASYICLDELHLHPRDFIKTWNDVILLLGYASAKRSQQSVCESCYNEYKTRIQTCSSCGKQYSVNKDGKEEPIIDKPMDISQILMPGSGQVRKPRNTP